jgi:hypothetical protein
MNEASAIGKARGTDPAVDAQAAATPHIGGIRETLVLFRTICRVVGKCGAGVCNRAQVGTSLRGQPDRKVPAVTSPGLVLHGQPAAGLEQQAETIGQRQRRFAIPAQIDAMQFIP